MQANLLHVECEEAHPTKATLIKMLNLLGSIMKILEKYGHTVEIAENGSLAVDAFKGRVSQGKPFDIILVRTPLHRW